MWTISVNTIYSKSHPYKCSNYITGYGHVNINDLSVFNVIVNAFISSLEIINTDVMSCDQISAELTTDPHDSHSNRLSHSACALTLPYNMSDKPTSFILCPLTHLASDTMHEAQQCKSSSFSLLSAVQISSV